jgi:hypothetical protein
MGKNTDKNGAEKSIQRELKVRGVRKKDIDADKVALAYVMLAKAIVSGTTSEEIDAAIVESRSHDLSVSPDALKGERR